MSGRFMLAGMGSQAPCILAPFALRLTVTLTKASGKRASVDVHLDGKTLAIVTEADALAGPGPAPCGPFVGGEQPVMAPFDLWIRHYAGAEGVGPMGPRILMVSPWDGEIVERRVWDIRVEMIRATAVSSWDSGTHNYWRWDIQPGGRILTTQIIDTPGGLGWPPQFAAFVWAGDWE